MGLAGILANNFGEGGEEFERMPPNWFYLQSGLITRVVRLIPIRVSMHARN
jgi:hypothetical protein